MEPLRLKTGLLPSIVGAIQTVTRGFYTHMWLLEVFIHTRARCTKTSVLTPSIQILCSEHMYTSKSIK